MKFFFPRFFPILIFLAMMLPVEAFAQSCCSGGSGSPIAGGTSQGVLYEGQLELGANFQYINSSVFMTGDQVSKNFLDNYSSQYLYSRLGYGISEKLTVSLEAGFFPDRTQIGLNKRDTNSSSGFGDLIIFPRYQVYSDNSDNIQDEITLGLGWKIPIGKHVDSSVVYTDESGQNFYTPKPPAIMQTTGSHDFIFYAFGYRGFPDSKFSLFTNFLYVRRGWNPLGQKFGDYLSFSVFGGKTLFEKLGMVLELKADRVAKMEFNPNIDMLALYNLDVNSTGSQRIVVAPQLSYSFGDLASFVSAEIPVYQYVHGTAIASQYQVTAGLSYRFFTEPTE